jgi:hypothetical protein
VGGEAFLDPAASYHVAQKTAGADSLPLSAQTLRHRMAEAGMLASVDTARKMLLVRRTLEGSPKQVLHLKKSYLHTRGEGEPKFDGIVGLWR